jgi:protein gp37
MGIGSKIEWTEATWNPTTGCDKISPGCKNCYAEGMSLRLKAMGQPNYRNGFKLTIHEHMLSLPHKWKTPKSIFVNSMSDLFHAGVPLDFIYKVFDSMQLAHWHRFQVLTKRSDRLSILGPKVRWSENIWMGVTVEEGSYLYRVDHLRSSGAMLKFLSLEPLLGPIEHIDFSEIDWVIVGGESGPSARVMEPGWVRDIRDQCISAGVPFFFKQWGGVNKKKTGRLLDGRYWDEMPFPRRARGQARALRA